MHFLVNLFHFLILSFLKATKSVEYEHTVCTMQSDKADTTEQLIASLEVEQ